MLKQVCPYLVEYDKVIKHCKVFINNVHLIMRNVRQLASYWRRVCSELIGMVRSLGAPTRFLTFSCNDLNWSDMLEALLLAAGRDPNEANSLTFSEKLCLVQRFPVIVSRQFMVRLNDLMMQSMLVSVSHMILVMLLKKQYKKLRDEVEVYGISYSLSQWPSFLCD